MAVPIQKQDNENSSEQQVLQDNTSGLLPKRQSCLYTSCYCEENVWKMCEEVGNAHPEKLRECYAVFISNDNRTVPLWCQKAAENEAAVCWDYHVVFISKCEADSEVYDLDTALSFPCKFTEYVDRAVRPNECLLKQFHRKFRAVTAADYLEKFASNRSHMLNDDKTWKRDPPPYPCIQTTESSNNIDDFISMDSSKGWGQVLDQYEFIVMFTRW